MLRRKAKPERHISDDTKEELRTVHGRLDKVERKVNYLDRQLQLARRQP